MQINGTFLQNSKEQTVSNNLILIRTCKFTLLLSKTRVLHLFYIYSLYERVLYFLTFTVKVSNVWKFIKPVVFWEPYQNPLHTLLYPPSLLLPLNFVSCWWKFCPWKFMFFPFFFKFDFHVNWFEVKFHPFCLLSVKKLSWFAKLNW